MATSEEEQVVTLLKEMIDGTIEIIEGCRKLTPLIIKKNIENDPDLMTIVAFESNTDEIPIGNIREYYYPKSLKKIDQEIEGYLEEMKPIILEACQNLIRKYSENRLP